MFNKLKQFKDLRDQAKTMQDALAGESVTEKSGGVELTMNGNLEITNVVVAEDLLSPDKKTKLENELIKRDAEKSVTLAMSEGKVTEALKPWAMSFAEKDLIGFSAWCAGAPKMVPDNKNLDWKESDIEALTETQIKVNNMLGIKPATKK